MKILDIVKLKTLIIIYKAKNNMLPINLQKTNIHNKETHSYGPRFSTKGKFNVNFCKTKRKLMSISIMGVKIWNQLVNVRNVKIINIFKHIIKNTFISLYDWYRFWGMFVILFTVQIQHVWYNIQNNICCCYNNYSFQN